MKMTPRRRKRRQSHRRSSLCLAGGCITSALRFRRAARRPVTPVALLLLSPDNDGIRVRRNIAKDMLVRYILPVARPHTKPEQTGRQCTVRKPSFRSRRMYRLFYCLQYSLKRLFLTKSKEKREGNNIRATGGCSDPRASVLELQSIEAERLSCACFLSNVTPH